MAQAQRELAPLGGTVLGVSFKDAAEDSRAFMRQHHLDYPDLRDVSGSFAEAFGTQALPESFLLDRSGHVLAISRGEIGAGFVERAVAEAKAG